MRDLVSVGLVGAVGVSNFGRDLVERCLAVGPVDSVQNQLSLLHRGDVDELLPWLAELGIAYLAYGSLAFGLLSGHVTDRSAFREGDWRGGGFVRYEANYYRELFAPGKLERQLEFVSGLCGLAEEIDVPVPLLALRWVLHQPGVTSLVAGSLNPAHIQANARAGEASLPRAAVERIDALIGRRGDD